MFTTLDKTQTEQLIDSDLGINVVKFIEIVENMGENNIFVDIGVETGKSSKILLNNAIQKNNKVFGIDPRPCLQSGILENPNYNIIKGDSVVIGKTWDKGNVSIVFIDSIHVKPQVMCELKYWWDLVKVDGWIIFHDTNWTWLDENGDKQYYVHKANHPGRGRKAGNSGLGYDTYVGINWETPDSAVKDFFNINSLTEDNDIITSINCPESLGMTFIHKKKEYDYSKGISDVDWQKYENDREEIIKCFM